MARHPPRLALLAALLPALPTWPAPAADGAAEVAAGGIELRSERRVALRRERLLVTPDRVRAEDELVNASPEDLSAEVVFSVPPYAYSPSRPPPDFRGFKAWVNDIDFPVEVEVRAVLGDRDVTGVLLAAGLDVATFGRQDTHSVSADGRSLQRVASSPQAAGLAPGKLQELVQLGVFEPAPALAPEALSLRPTWSVRATYHWLQHFPPGQVVRIRHEYRPAAGFQAGIPARLLAEACANPALRRRAGGKAQESGVTGSRVSWVKVLLATAGAWRRPVGDLELTVEGADDEYLSFCWDGPIRKTGPHTYQATLRDFVPTRDLTVYSFKPGPDRPAAR